MAFKKIRLNLKVIYISNIISRLSIVFISVKLSAMKYQRVSHLDAVQGSNEERVNRTYEYGERVTEAADAAMRQKHLMAGQHSWADGRCGG